MAKRSGRPSSAQTPAPKSDKIVGSNTNKKGSATSKGASSITLSDKTISALKTKLEDFKKKYPKKDNVTLSDLKAVYRRGSGAYSGSHRPNVSRAGWRYGRTNKFLEKAAGKKVKAAYVQDDDLLKYEEGALVSQNVKPKKEGYITKFENGFYWLIGVVDGEIENIDGDKKLYVVKDMAKRWGYKLITKDNFKKKYGNVQDDDLLKYEEGGLIAPNGKKSNLTPEQYKLVRTPEFKAWFGDWENDPENASKVVDENGEPLVVYRGFLKRKNLGNVFRYNIKNFRDAKNRQKNTFAFYFTNEKEVAKEYGENLIQSNENYIVQEYFLNIRNLFVAIKEDNEAVKNKKYDKKIDKILAKEDLTFKEIFDLTNPNEKDLNYLKEWGWRWEKKYNFSKQSDSTFTYFVDWNKDESNQDFWEVYLKRKGYDGLCFYESTHNIELSDKWERKLKFDKLSITYCAFESNQIKLADGSNTTFDSNNLDIRYEKGGIVKNEQFYNWYLDWYKNDVEGMSIMFTLPSEFTKVSNTSENDIILDVFEKTNESVNAKKYLQEIIDNADKFGVTIYLHPIPRTHKLKSEEYKKKITKDYLISYYEKFGFVLDADKFFMVRKPKGNYEEGGKVGEDITCGNCGWEWNTSDSKGKDKYTCHKCGKINKMKKNTKAVKNKKTDYYEKYKGGAYLKKGGQLNPDDKSTKDFYAHKSGNAGGMLVGKRHSEGGIKAVNKSTGQPLEMEGGETVITRDAVSDNTKREFEGEMLTNRQILSRINVSGGGVSFEKGGDVPDKCACSGKKYKYGGKLIPDFDIVNQMIKVPSVLKKSSQNIAKPELPINIKKVLMMQYERFISKNKNN